MTDQNVSSDVVEPILFPFCSSEDLEPSSSSSSSLSSPRIATAAATFDEACALACETGRPLVLREDALVSQTIVLKKRQHLVIRCMDQRQKLRGPVHSLFLLNNQSRLTLQNIELHHILESDDHRKIGAAVNLRYKAFLEMTDCLVHSQSGFCCWAVQKTRVTLTNCELRAPARSAVVCFGQATCHLKGCRVPDAGVHAICARGACRLELEECEVTRSAARAIYAYANASVTLKKCTVSHTLHPGKAAIEISAAGCATPEGNSTNNNKNNSSNNNQQNKNKTLSSLDMQDCNVVDNAGAGICLRGPVSCTITGNNVLERNAGGNVLEKDLLTDKEDDDNDLKNNQVRRDVAGTSFRRGDWWCPKCPLYVLLDRQSQCSRCAAPKSQGRPLTVQEIHRCNQGTAIIEATTTTTWSFDADDKGWLAYDAEGSRLLEEAYQQYSSSSDSADSAKKKNNNPSVLIAGGKYQVNVATMEQINVESHFMRLVRRQVEQG
jgi:hypothetical protein